MRLVTFSRKNEQRLGLMGPQEQIIDLAEVNRRYLKGGNPPFLASMQAFIEAGGEGGAGRPQSGKICRRQKAPMNRKN